MENKFDAIGMGGVSVDMVGEVETFPRGDVKQKLSDFVCHAGGTVGNTAVGLARLGCTSRYMGKLSQANVFARMAIETMEREGVEVMPMDDGEDAGPYLAMILAEQSSGQRTVFWTDYMVRSITASQISQQMITSARVLHLDDWDFHDAESALQAVTWAKEAGMMVLLNAEHHDKHQYQAVFKWVDYLIVNDQYAQDSTSIKDVALAAQKLMSLGAGSVIVTQGQDGCIVCTQKKRFHQEAFTVKAVDTTGCGDAFRAGLIYGLLKQGALEAAVECASAVAALKCMKLGPQTGLTTEDQLKKFLAAHGSKTIRSYL